MKDTRVRDGKRGTESSANVQEFPCVHPWRLSNPVLSGFRGDLVAQARLLADPTRPVCSDLSFLKAMGQDTLERKSIT